MVGRFQRRDHAFPVSGTLRHGDFAPARGEPFDLLQLHPIPRRIADHGVKSAGQPFVFPIRPHAGETHLPIQEAFFINQLAGLGKDFSEPIENLLRGPMTFH
jgi:hypothetical protein